MDVRARRRAPDKTSTDIAPSTLLQDAALSSTPTSRADSLSSHAGQSSEVAESPEQTLIGQPMLAGHQFQTVSVNAPQAKFAVSQPGEPLEQEADHIADLVVDSSETENEDSISTSEGEITKAKASPAGIVGQSRRQAPSAPTEPPAPPRTVERLPGSPLGSGGAPLSSAARGSMQPRFGHDFSQVRVHTDEAASRSAQALSAHAFTFGTDIVFAAGKYAPGTRDGDRLLAHELTHVVQQTGTPESAVSGASDATVSRRADMSSTFVGSTPIIFRDKDPSTGDIQGAGDEAQAKAQKTPLQVDTVSVQTDRNRVGELIAEIDKHTPIIKQAEKENSDMESMFSPLATNTATKANLSVFNDKLDVSNVDTTAFASQYRIVFADYQRLTAEAAEFLSRQGAGGGDVIGAAAERLGNAPGLKIGAGQAGLERFRAARQNMNTAGRKMDSQLSVCRGAANLLQGAVYKARAAAAAANGKDAATKLAAVRAEIAEVAGGVGKVVKICSAVAGLAGGGGATNALATPKETGGSIDIDPSISGLAKGGTVLDPQEASKKALLQAMGTDAASVVGSGGGPEGMAESLVKAIGEYANKDQISRLQQNIIKAAAEESSFNAAGDAQSMVGYQEQMDGAAKQLSLLLEAFAGAKKEMNDASQALMAELSKGGAKGKEQARDVLFLTDADRFLAQVNNSISVGENQQKNLKQAAGDRKALRGTTGASESQKDSKASQYYWRCHKTTVPGKLWGTNDLFKLEKVFVTFQDSGGFGQNDINQGGAGSVEGTGSADDEVARKIDVLRKAKEQVTVLQTKVQGALGMGGPGISA